MLRCPNTECNATTKELRYIGPVLIAEGTLTVDSMGRVVALGPARATVTVKTGSELKSSLMRAMCPQCGGQFPIGDFKPVRICMLSGKEATVSVTAGGQEMWVAEDQLELAQTIFSEERMRWEVPYTEDILDV